MKDFFGRDYLLSNDTARMLYEDYAADMPIFDFHNHLSPEEIARDHMYGSITDLWLGGDHYKWRVMRAADIDERFITGDGEPYEKFLAFAKTLERLPGNPVYHWAHLELRRYFGAEEALTQKSAPAIYEACNTRLKEPGYSACGLLRRMGVKALCTTDDPFDDLRWHRQMRGRELGFSVLPTFRPDKLLHIDQPKAWRAAVVQMEEKYGTINDYDSLISALSAAIAHFADAGCILSDHGFIRFAYMRGGEKMAARAVDMALNSEVLSPEQAGAYKSALLRHLAREYTRHGMGMQLHLGAQRNNNARLFEALGPDAGADSIGETTPPAQLGALLDDLHTAGTLPNTVLYCLNPADFPVLATMALNFGARVQLGAAWWFNDHVRGIRAQLNELMEGGMLGRFVGMLTDSRSFTSFTRHEYFRRILCDVLGQVVEAGEYPAADVDALGRMVQDICYHNAAQFFGLNT